jgi:hypothetical protein
MPALFPLAYPTSQKERLAEMGTQTTKNVASVTPTTPTFDSFASLPSRFNPTFGTSASDLLNDQVDLSYQIMNLQMILERAPSDRLYTEPVH